MRDHILILCAAMSFTVIVSCAGSRIRYDKTPEIPGYMYSVNVDKLPIQINRKNLAEFYPEKAKRLNVKRCDVIALCYIGIDGAVEFVEVVVGDRINGFDDAARKYLESLDFRPAKKDGAPVKCAHYYVLHFSLE